MPKSVPASRMVALSYWGWLATKAGSSRQAANRPSPKPARLTRLRYSAGMIWSVSTLVCRSGTARPVWVVNGSMGAVSCYRSTGLQVGGGELVRVHAQAHRAAGRAPFGPGLGEHRVQALLLGLGPDLHGAGHDQHPDGRGDPATAQHVGGGPQVLEPAVGARPEEDGV